MCWEPTWESCLNVEYYKTQGWHPRRILHREGQKALVLWTETWEPLSSLIESGAVIDILRFYLAYGPTLFEDHKAQFPALRDIIWTEYLQDH